jgi:hypothetical protein
MVQYYKIVILNNTTNNENEVVKAWLHPWDHGHGNKLLEHSWIGNKFMYMIEHLISQNGPFYMSRIIWCGDYANNEDDKLINLYVECDQKFSQSQYIVPTKVDNSPYRYIINHTKKMYVDKEYINKDNDYDGYDYDSYRIHPLPLLVLDKYKRSGRGDYFGINQELCGIWARDVISLENDIPSGYTELICEFS